MREGEGARCDDCEGAERAEREKRTWGEKNIEGGKDRKKGKEEKSKNIDKREEGSEEGDKKRESMGVFEGTERGKGGESTGEEKDIEGGRVRKKGKVEKVKTLIRGKKGEKKEK